MKRFFLLAGLLAALGAMPAHADGDAAAGKNKSQVCAACHNADGNSVNPVWPKLADQNPHYIDLQLHYFKSGKRQNAIMNGQAAGLSDQDMADLAAYFSSQTLKPGTTDPKLAKQGEKLYRGGDASKGVPACIACHGPSGLGNNAAGYPRIGGQHAQYIIAQLNNYASGQRKTDPNQMMRNVASRLSDDQMQAVASYLEGLVVRPASEDK